jgi:hypothetical protein
MKLKIDSRKRLNHTATVMFGMLQTRHPGEGRVTVWIPASAGMTENLPKWRISYNVMSAHQITLWNEHWYQIANITTAVSDAKKARNIISSAFFSDMGNSEISDKSLTLMTTCVSTRITRFVP